MDAPVAALGGWFWRQPARLGRFVNFQRGILGAGYRLYVGRHGWGSALVSKRVILAQAWFTGVQALPLIGLAGLLISAAMMGAGHRTLAGLGAEDNFGLLMRVAVLGELGPLLTALVVVARSGTAITTELARMRIENEIDGVRAHGIDPLAYLAVPRLLGVAAANLALTIVLCGMVYLGCLLQAPLMDGLGVASFARGLADAVLPGDLLRCALKGLLFGLAIPMVTIFQGFHVARDVNDVPRAGSRAVVGCQILIFGLDALVTVLL